MLVTLLGACLSSLICKLVTLFVYYMHSVKMWIISLLNVSPSLRIKYISLQLNSLMRLCFFIDVALLFSGLRQGLMLIWWHLEKSSCKPYSRNIPIFFILPQYLLDLCCVRVFILGLGCIL